jgi:5-oxopent-3-ene-1,2,5-tricarboxylate decarboxylase / 2-hydroxyhepta-2,4-diene-1,7-dioate isomerase
VKGARFIAGGRYHEGHLEDEGTLVDESGAAHRGDEVTWLPPVAPGKVIGLALNYADHAEELGLERPPQPVLFFKPSNSWAGHRTPVLYPQGVEYMHYENELAAVIGRRCRRVKARDAAQVVRGYTIANDVTVRDFVTNLYRPPVKAKGWDTFGPLGPYLVEGEIEDPDSLELRTYVNDELRQEGSTKQLMWRVPEIIEFITEFMTLEANDIILTGTPKGLSHVYPGDTMRLEIDGLGALENHVVAESDVTHPEEAAH